MPPLIEWVPAPNCNGARSPLGGVLLVWSPGSTTFMGVRPRFVALAFVHAGSRRTVPSCFLS